MNTVLRSGAGVQSPLPLFAGERPADSPTFLADRNLLLRILGDAQWHTARELKVHGFTDRELRELVENSDGQIFSFPGSPGYKLFDFVTEDEFQQCSSLKHQAERMLARYSRYQARHHRGK